LTPISATGNVVNGVSSDTSRLDVMLSLKRTHSVIGVLSAVAFTIVTAVSPGVPSTALIAHDWASAGQNVADTHYAGAERILNEGNVSRLTPKWTFTTGDSVSATPTVVNGIVYVPDWAGNLYAIDAATGQQIWDRKISDYTGIPGDVSRLSPAFWRGELITGDGVLTGTSTSGAFVLGVDAATGVGRWRTRIDSDPAAIVTGAPVVFGGVAYVGVSSRAETLSGNPTFRGSMVAIDARTGRILWHTYTVPVGYTGGAIWGSSAVVDTKTGLLYAGVGNNYTTPPGVCALPDQTGCVAGSPANHIDSVLAFDLRTGAIVWARPTLTADTWTIAQRFGPDFDFGASPNLYTTMVNGVPTDLLGIGQKSGVYWALDPATGRIVWATAVGPGGNGGGIEWGTATDGHRIYVGITNSGNIPVAITSASGQQSTTTGGLWAALDAGTGRILWQTADPQTGLDFGFISAANGVVYGGSLTPTGNNMYAIDTSTGAIRWAFPSGGSVAGGAAIVNGTVYWGSGYHTEDIGLGFRGDNDKLYAFSLGGP
jgi:outer membrane protein assembly factor BamB